MMMSLGLGLRSVADFSHQTELLTKASPLISRVKGDAVWTYISN